MTQIKSFFFLNCNGIKKLDPLITKFRRNQHEKCYSAHCQFSGTYSASFSFASLGWRLLLQISASYLKSYVLTHKYNLRILSYYRTLMHQSSASVWILIIYVHSGLSEAEWVTTLIWTNGSDLSDLTVQLCSVRGGDHAITSSSRVAKESLNHDYHTDNNITIDLYTVFVVVFTVTKI
jgi:hypothetical protein